ncbi:MAG: Tm-1-like ATP-binding domain-containing protein, partial [Nitratireductor sp.]
MKRVYVVGTADTKGAELAYLATRIADCGAAVTVVDIGTGAAADGSAFAGADFVPASEVAAHGGGATRQALAAADRGSAVAAMTDAFCAFVTTRTDMAGMIGIGGGGGTVMVTAGMRALPIGLPKLMVSTLASGDVAPYVDVSDIIMMPSITDMAGLNRISRVILDNAARAIAAMATQPAAPADDRPAVGLTMFGVTTACVTAVVEALKSTHDCLVFHATGTGGRTMETLAASGMLEGMLDVTTTEICDLLVGGVLPARD